MQVLPLPVRKMMMLYRRIKGSLQRRRYRGTLRRLYLKFAQLTPRLRQAKALQRAAELEFDRVHHVETAEVVPLADLAIAGGCG